MRSRGSAASSGGAIYASTPQTAAILDGFNNNDDTNGSFGVTVDARTRKNAYLENTPAAINNYWSHLFTLGPKGSIWACRFAYATAPDAGKVKLSLASVPEPDPQRAGVDDVGTLLRSDDVTYVQWLSNLDHYGAVFGDREFGGQAVVRLTGDDHAPMTFIGNPVDPWTGYSTTDGGAGVYRLRMTVYDKNAASTGYKMRITGLAMIRLDDNGFV